MVLTLQIAGGILLALLVVFGILPAIGESMDGARRQRYFRAHAKVVAMLVANGISEHDAHLIADSRAAGAGAAEIGSLLRQAVEANRRTAGLPPSR